MSDDTKLEGMPTPLPAWDETLSDPLTDIRNLIEELRKPPRPMPEPTVLVSEDQVEAMMEPPPCASSWEAGPSFVVVCRRGCHWLRTNGRVDRVTSSPSAR